jgi:hypothetical protein
LADGYEPRLVAGVGFVWEGGRQRVVEDGDGFIEGDTVLPEVAFGFARVVLEVETHVCHALGIVREEEKAVPRGKSLPPGKVWGWERVAAPAAALGPSAERWRLTARLFSVGLKPHFPRLKLGVYFFRRVKAGIAIGLSRDYGAMVLITVDLPYVHYLWCIQGNKVALEMRVS